MTFTRDALGDKIINRIGGYEKLTKKHRAQKETIIPQSYPPESREKHSGGCGFFSVFE